MINLGYARERYYFVNSTNKIVRLRYVSLSIIARAREFTDFSLSLSLASFSPENLKAKLLQVIEDMISWRIFLQKDRKRPAISNRQSSIEINNCT